MHGIQEGLSCSKANLIVHKFERSKWLKGQNGHTKVNIELVQYVDVKNIIIHAILRSSFWVHKAAWPWGSLKVLKGLTKVNIELVQDFHVDYTIIKLQLDKAIYEEVFARPFWMPLAHLPACLPRQRKYTASLRGWGVKIGHNPSNQF